MISVDDKTEAHGIVELVQKYLDKHQPEDFRLTAQPDIQKEDEWYYVLVTPSKPDVHSYEYNVRMVEAEMELEDKEKKKVLLVPVLPD